MLQYFNIKHRYRLFIYCLNRQCKIVSSGKNLVEKYILNVFCFKIKTSNAITQTAALTVQAIALFLPVCHCLFMCFKLIINNKF